MYFKPVKLTSSTSTPWRGVETYLHSLFWTSELDAVEWLASRLDRINLENELLYPLTRWVGGIQSGSGLSEEPKNILTLTGFEHL